MDLISGLKARLQADVAIAVAVDTRVHANELPQDGQLPAITLTVISDPRPQHLKGQDGARGTRVQMDVWALRYEQVAQIAAWASVALHPPATIDGKRFGPARIDGARDLPENLSDGKRIYRRSVDLIVWHAGE